MAAVNTTGVEKMTDSEKPRSSAGLLVKQVVFVVAMVLLGAFLALLVGGGRLPPGSPAVPWVSPEASDSVSLAVQPGVTEDQVSVVVRLA